MNELEEYFDLSQKVVDALEKNKGNTRVEIQKVEEAANELHARLYDDWQMEQ